VRYPDGAAYAAAKRRYLDGFDPAWTPAQQEGLTRTLAGIGEHQRKLGEVFFFPSGPGMGLMGMFGEVGLEAFSYYLADYPDLIDELLECHTQQSIAWVEHLPEGHGIEAVFSGDDIAFKTGPLLSPAWFSRHYFPRMARLMAAYHIRGIKVLFHSDGNLNSILGGLVDAGIDGLNPIEVLAGMDVGDLHRRYPRLFLAGGIDVSQLLPYGSPQQVKEAVRRALEAGGGRVLVGSSTELNDQVPLANYLALRETVLETPYR
jgi:uroporphyrinogen decarboxylase